jgi:hypothetical protein
MEEKDIFKFEDFLGSNKIEDLKKMKSNLLKEGLFSGREGYIDEEDDDSGIFAGHIQRQMKDDKEDEVINQDFNPYKYDDITNNIHNKSLGNEDDEYFEDDIDIEDDFYDDITNDIHNKSIGYSDKDAEEPEDLDESKSESEDYYKLFRDKAEDFVCDIAVEGVNQNNTQVRLIVESDEWNLIFTGEIKNGKCIIPIKKLNILNEGQTGNIKLEVNADGNLFTPWEDKFIIKASKKVSVKLNEKIKSIKSKPGVKVNVKRSK